MLPRTPQYDKVESLLTDIESELSKIAARCYDIADKEVLYDPLKKEDMTSTGRVLHLMSQQVSILKEEIYAKQD